MDRIQALKGADGVLCTVFNGDIDIWRYDIEIPKKYGVDINVGDTRSVSGIFRALRNIPLMLEICRDIEKYCPRAVFLNYTNPMAMLCGAMQKHSNVEVTGLCHSVQGTIRMLCEWLNVPEQEVVYHCMGVNHQAFYTKLEHNGEDLYPRLRKLLENETYYNKEQVRNLHLRLERQKNWEKQYQDFLAKDVDPNKSPEYAADIFNSRLGDGKPFVFNGNVLNNGSIPNLPADACVEIPVVSDYMGFKPTVAGPLPAHLAILVNTPARIESLTVEAAMKKSREMVYQAVYMDPLSSAVCSLEEIRRMVDELFEANRAFLGDYT